MTARTNNKPTRNPRDHYPDGVKRARIPRLKPNTQNSQSKKLYITLRVAYPALVIWLGVAIFTRYGNPPWVLGDNSPLLYYLLLFKVPLCLALAADHWRLRKHSLAPRDADAMATDTPITQ